MEAVDPVEDDEEEEDEETTDELVEVVGECVEECVECSWEGGSSLPAPDTFPTPTVPPLVLVVALFASLVHSCMWWCMFATGSAVVEEAVDPVAE